MVRKTCPVDVISVCSASGDIRPLRLRVEDEEQGLIRVNIDEVISVKEVPYVGVEARIFLCGDGGRAAAAICAEIPHPRPLLVPDGQGVLIFRSGNYGEIVVLWW